ncbi:Momilactone A synthase [Camellia lanceoleosa]|uniref:Momilactone A synthase n=1 Tax=Camellia lanceoleosa TaxID=1840588 RepID=A0ACC0F3M0_9ERIC|nr:Momilactone A synthase [Camellia lanceoleosa]
MFFKLEGKVTIITGAASGIGEATARLFAQNGAFVVIADIQDEFGVQVVASIGPHKSSYRHCDVRVEKHVQETIAFAIEKYGTLDIMHSNAGIMGSGPHPYTTSKHALVGLVRSAASELGKHGIRVNCVSPSGLATGLVSASGVKNMDKSAIEALATALANLKGIVLKANHVAEAVLFLASDESVYVSGHNLAVDGGVSVVNTAMTMMKR